MSKRLLQALLALAILFPFGFLAMLSVGRQWIFPDLWPREWTLAHWRYLLAGNSDLARSLLLSLAISLSMAVVVTLLSFVVSRVISYHRRKPTWLLAAYLPYVFAPVILAACIQYYFIRLGLSGTIGGIMVAQLLITFPFGVIFFTGFWNEQMLATEQLVATLGGTPAQAFRRALLPMARGPLLICFFQTFLISWFEYGLTLLIGVGKVQTLTIKVFQYVNEANIFLAALAGVLLTIPPVILLWLNKRFIFTRS